MRADCIGDISGSSRTVRRFALLGVLSVIGSMPLAAQSPASAVSSGAVAGVVRGWRDGLSAIGVRVEVQEVPGLRGSTWRHVADTDSTGRFHAMLPPGRYLIRARDIGQNPMTIPMFVRPADTVRVALYMGPYGFDIGVRDMQLVELATNRARWNAAAVKSYTAEISRECFCLGSGIGTFMVRVQNGNVVRGADSVAGDEQFLPHTIDTVFDWLEAAMREPDSRTAVQYDPVLGFPISVDSESRSGTTDTWTKWRVRSLTRVP